MDDREQAQNPADSRPDEGEQPETGTRHPETFPIVGMGASAGGLDAYTRFFEALPDDPGMAFVLIQHLDPNHESMVPDLLSRHTRLKVMQVQKRTAVEKNVVYIIPPGKYLGLQDRHLVLCDPPRQRDMRITIDDADRGRFRQTREHSESQLLEMNELLAKKVDERTAKLERKRNQLKRLASELSQIEQRERRRLASTLHDNLQQIIAASRFRLDMLAEAFDLKESRHFAPLQDMLQEAADACRNVTIELAPPVLYEDGLVPALQWLCKWFEEKHGLNVECDIPPLSVAPVDDDESVLLFQCVKELMFNVVKHSGVNQAVLSVRETEDGFLKIGVSDKGRGIDAERLEGVGEEGEGFGLFSIRERLSIIGGRMNIEDGPGKGARVILLAPSQQVKGAGAAEDLPTRTLPDVSRGRDRGNVRLLLVDDHAIFRSGLVSLLTTIDIVEVVGEAADGEEAVEKTGDLRPDVILMDINMPKMNGIDATRKILKKFPETRIIGLSVSSEDEIAESMMSAGAVSYVTKGEDSSKLIDAIRRQAVA